MAKRNIIAYFMDESEREFALARMSEPAKTDSFLVGEIEEDQIAELEQKGLIVEKHVGGGLPPAAAGEEAEPPAMRRRSIFRTIDRPGPTGMEREPAAEDQYILRLKGPLLEDWKKRIEDAGVTLRERVSRIGGYRVKLSFDQLRRLEALPFVESVRLIEPGVAAAPRATRGVAPGAPAGAVKLMLSYDLLLEEPEANRDEILSWLDEHHVPVGAASDRKIRIYLLEDSPLIDEIAFLPGVRMEQYIPPKLANDRARVLLGVDDATPVIGSLPPPILPQQGEGQIVAIADTGIDESHVDIPPARIVGVIARGRNLNPSDPDGHGTHVAGSVLGDGTASGGEIRGVAPAAKLFFQSILDDRGGLGGLPFELGELFEEAYQQGARIHNNSWGAETASAYTVNAREVDEFVAKHRDMLVVFAAGNAGTGKDVRLATPGFVEWGSLDSPATSKNALTVGASRSDRKNNGYSNLTYGALWPEDYPQPPMYAEKVSGNDQGLAGFSSRGPCHDHRIKPDVVSPGTDIVSTKSSTAPWRNFWGPFPGNPNYAINGGTSMAAPLVAGCAALIREYYVKEAGRQPSAALLRATLMNSTLWLSGQDSNAEHDKLPNYHQGFGRVYMPYAIPNAGEPDLTLRFFDNWQDPASHFVRTGQNIKFRFTVEEGRELRLCLAYTDHPASGLQNNLSMTLQRVGGPKKWVGNEDLPMKIATTDTVNNVEVIRLTTPSAGEYLVLVYAQNLLFPGQDFALAVTGKNLSPLIRV
ncbi:MAG: hypothetical protein EHM61_15515 [Acidobacteria bacterium]|nr:MAG: hypothetical protein EHM61_15515 [Acidobacteriota bacterium]